LEPPVLNIRRGMDPEEGFKYFHQFSLAQFTMIYNSTTLRPPHKIDSKEPERGLGNENCHVCVSKKDASLQLTRMLKYYYYRKMIVKLSHL